MNNELTMNNTYMSEEERKQEELFNTIKMEPILEKTLILEEPLIKMKKKRIKVTDYVLMSLIAVVSTVFVLVVLNVL